MKRALLARCARKTPGKETRMSTLSGCCCCCCCTRLAFMSGVHHRWFDCRLLIFTIIPPGENGTRLLALFPSRPPPFELNRFTIQIRARFRASHRAAVAPFASSHVMETSSAGGVKRRPWPFASRCLAIERGAEGARRPVSQLISSRSRNILALSYEPFA